MAAAGGVAVAAIMVLSYLREVDAAYAVAEGLLLRKGPLIGSLWPDSSQMRINDQQWRRTMNLFTPATEPMRADPRFNKFCQEIGLAGYWASRRGPDPMFRLG